MKWKEKTRYIKIQLIGKLASIITTKFIVEKYIDPGILVVTITINNFSISNTLIDLGAL